MDSTLKLIREFADDIDAVAYDKPQQNKPVLPGDQDKITRIQRSIRSLRGWLGSLEDRLAEEEAPKQELWKAILAKCEEIQHAKPHTGSSRGIVYYGSKDRAICILGLSLPNGTKETNILEASRWRGEITVSVQSSISNNDSFWKEKVKFKRQLVIVNHVCYSIGSENSSSSFRGFSGRKFNVEFTDGRVVETTNLWYIGTIPPYYRRQLKDNAKFIKEE